MSVNLMSAIFETEFRDLTDADGNVTKASTAKLVLLAMADNANDDGDNAYPSVERLERKTALSDQTIRNVFDALRFNGIIELKGKSKHGTNNHTINTRCFPKAIGKEVTHLTLYPLDPQMGTVLPPNGYLTTTEPFDPNHITIKETSRKTDGEKAKYRDPMWDVLHGQNPTAEGIERDRRAKLYTDVANRLSAGLRRGEFPQTTEAQKVYRWIAEQEERGQSLSGFIAWATEGKRAEFTFVYHRDPSLIKRDWPQVYTSSDSIPATPDSDGGYR